jgi:hypothetical protein
LPAFPAQARQFLLRPNQFLSTNCHRADDIEYVSPWAFGSDFARYEVMAATFAATVCVGEAVTGLNRYEKAQSMASKRKNSQPNANKPHLDDSQQLVLERVQELTWALLDDNISDDEMSLLDTLLLTGDDARNRYIECVQMHTDLMAHYAAPGKSGSTNGPAVLSLLKSGSSSLGAQSPEVAE